jgi:hypothetical protein
MVMLKSYPITGPDGPFFLGLLEVEAPRIYRQSAHEGAKLVSSTHRPFLPEEASQFKTVVTQS